MVDWSLKRYQLQLDIVKRDESLNSIRNILGLLSSEQYP